VVGQQIDDPRATLSTRFQAVERGLALRTATTGLGWIGREDFSQRVDPAPGRQVEDVASVIEELVPRFDLAGMVRPGRRCRCVTAVPDVGIGTPREQETDQLLLPFPGRLMQGDLAVRSPLIDVGPQVEQQLETYDRPIGCAVNEETLRVNELRPLRQQAARGLGLSTHTCRSEAINVRGELGRLRPVLLEERGNR